MTRFTRSSLMGRKNTITPVIIIRLLGRSIRSHAVSTADIFARLGTVIRVAGKRCGKREREVRSSRPRLEPPASRRARIAHAFSFALK